jgi:hypothetical protein
MARRTLFLLFIIFAITGCYAQHAKVLAPLKEEPRAAEADPYSWDFGRVKEGKILKHDFVLKNDSSRTVKIKDVDTSCGCTASTVKKNTLSPGESTIIEVKFNTKGYAGPTQQFVYVNTDNLDNSVIRFIIKADVVK